LLIFKVILTGLVRDLKGKEIKEFMQYYFDRLDEVKDVSDEEFEKYKKDIRAEWEDLEEPAQKELHEKYPGTEAFLEGE
jgi:hypothetical protein